MANSDQQTQPQSSLLFQPAKSWMRSDNSVRFDLKTGRNNGRFAIETH